MRKLLLSIGSSTLIVAPLVVASCSSTNDSSLNKKLTGILRTGDKTKIYTLVKDLFNGQNNKQIDDAANIISDFLSNGASKLNVEFKENIGATGFTNSFDAITLSIKGNKTLGYNPPGTSTSTLNIKAPFAIVFGKVNGIYSSISISSPLAPLASRIGVPLTNEESFKLASVRLGDWGIRTFVQTRMGSTSRKANDGELSSNPNLVWKDPFTTMYINNGKRFFKRSNVTANDFVKWGFGTKDNPESPVDNLINGFNSNLKREPYYNTSENDLKPENLNFKLINYEEGGKQLEGVEVSIMNYGPVKKILLKGFKEV